MANHQSSEKLRRLQQKQQQQLPTMVGGIALFVLAGVNVYSCERASPTTRDCVCMDVVVYVNVGHKVV